MFNLKIKLLVHLVKYSVDLLDQHFHSIVLVRPQNHLELNKLAFTIVTQSFHLERPSFHFLVAIIIATTINAVVAHTTVIEYYIAMEKAITDIVIVIVIAVVVTYMHY